MSFSSWPRILRWVSIVAAINVVVFSLFRIAFWWYFSDSSDPISGRVIEQVFWVGFKYDLRLTLFLITPVLLLAWYRRFSPFYSKAAFATWVAYFSFSMFLILLFYFLNFGHYAYLRTPLDATALRFLQNFQTSALMMWQSYPVVWLTLGLLLLTLVYSIGIAGPVYFLREQESPNINRMRKIVLSALVAFFVLFGMYGKLSWYPLRWSDAFTFSHPFASAVTINPVLYSLTTLKNKSVEYDLKAVKSSYEQVTSYLGVEQGDPEKLIYQRVGKPNLYKADRPNVIIVILESFADYKSSTSGNPLDPTPNFQKLAQQGIYFKQFYTPHAGTARSVFTTVTGLADVEKVKTSTRNPLVVNQHSIINEFRNYKKYYFLGGSASWGNIRGLLSNNIDLEIYEEGSYSSPRVDVWGISDLHLFEEANLVLRTVKQPFFAVIQTSGNHRPYTIPDDRRDFKVLSVPEKKVQRYGFHSEEEYNSFRFMDYSIGHFMKLARQESYFENTLFVFYGDHGINYNPGEHSRKAEGQLNLGNIHVPLVFYSPKIIQQAKVVTKIASEVDVLPTVAAMSLDSYRNTTMGRDLFDESFDAQRYALTTILHGHMRVGLIGEKFYFTMSEDGSAKTLHLLDSDSPRDNVIASHQDQANEMERLSRSLYETTRYMRYNNPRLN